MNPRIDSNSASLGELMRGVVSALAAVYGLVAAVDFFVFSSGVSATVAAAVVLSLLAFRFLCIWDDLDAPQAELRGLIVAAVLLLSGVLHLYFVPSPWQVVHVVPPVLGAGWVFRSTRSLALVLVGSLAVWGVAASSLLPENEWIVTALVLWAAAVVAVVNRQVHVRGRLLAEHRAGRPDQGVAWFDSTLDVLPVDLATLDEEGGIIASNQRWRDSIGCHLFSSNVKDVPDNYLERLGRAADNGSEDAREIASGIRLVSAGDKPDFTHEYSCGKRRFRIQVSRLPGGDRRRTLLVHEELTALQQAKEQLRHFEQRYAAAFRTANDGLWDWNLQTKEIYLSPRWKRMLGFGEEEVSNKPEEWLERIHGRDARALLTKLSDHLDGRSDEFEGQHRMKHGDGSYRWMQTRGVAVRDEAGKALRIVGSQVDITAQKRAEELKQHEEMFDPLTGLPNRRHFREQLKRVAGDTGSKTNVLYALLYVDLDRFKVVNDSLGHTVGDHLLVGISDRIKQCLRPGDSIARLGGDEFAILLENLNHVSQAKEIANRIQVEVARPFKVGTQEVYTAVSVGIAMGGYGRESPGNLLRDADTAKNRAKSLGRARCELFSHNMQADALDLLSMETALRRALERDEFIIHYQPIISVSSGRITSCEALLRWNHPEKGMVSPKEFIPIAEQSGLIKGISEWTLYRACRQAKEWRRLEMPSLRVSVNISPQLLSFDDFAEMVMKALDEAELEPQSLQLELTESVLMEIDPATIQPLVALSAKGVQIALDDFGTGYSSLGYLQRVPVNALKIDESFIRYVAINPGDAAIASGLIALAHNVNIRVTVEGVETQDQFEFCAAKGCEEFQGILFSPPVAPEAFVSLLQAEDKGPSLVAKSSA